MAIYTNGHGKRIPKHFYKMKDPRDKKVNMDEDGNEYLINNNGEYVTDEFVNKIPPTQTSKVDKSSSGFRTYDTSQGHCALCGRLTCNGGCFK